MKKIFALPSHTFTDRISGVDFLRIIQPMKHLNGYEGRFEVKVYDPSKDGSFDWRDVFDEYDAVYFNYTTNDIGYAVMGYLAQKNNKKLICDVDDDLFNILSDNSAYDVFKKGSWGLSVVKAILGDVSMVTCTNSHLKHSIMQNTKAKDITVLPNYIDLNVYNHRATFKDRGYYKALHFGSSTHFASFYSPEFLRALDRVMKNYPNFSFITVGAFVSEFKDKWGVRYEQGFGDTDIMKWIAKMPQFIDDADFMLVPLLDNTYNRSKSNCKYLEASSCKIAGVYQDIRQYREVIKNGENGFLCQNANEWYNAITRLIEDAQTRRDVGEKAFATIEDHTIQKNIKKYADMFDKII